MRCAVIVVHCIPYVRLHAHGSTTRSGKERGDPQAHHVNRPLARYTILYLPPDSSFSTIHGMVSISLPTPSHDWAAIATLVRGRTERQCVSRWRDSLKHSIARIAGRAGTWTEDEDDKLKDAVHKHGGKNWIAIAKLVRGRTKRQCASRWHDFLKHSIARIDGRTGPWTIDEDGKLNDAVHKHSGKDWATITALLPGRTINQCRGRWTYFLKQNSIALTPKPWSTGEDSKLKDAVHMHNDWAVIAKLVPRRTKVECWCRWHDHLKHIIDQVRQRYRE
jgi:hypothetical protein